MLAKYDTTNASRHTIATDGWKLITVITCIILLMGTSVVNKTTQNQAQLLV